MIKPDVQHEQLKLEFYPLHPDSPGPEHLQTHKHSHSAHSHFTSLIQIGDVTGQNRVSPLGAVLVAGLALARLVGVFPDERVSVSRNAVRAARHAVRAVFMMGALGALVWTLQGETRTHTHLSVNIISDT